MFLSNVFLTGASLSNGYEWHRALWSMFPGFERKENEPAPFLFRMEEFKRNGARAVVQSKIEPIETETGANIKLNLIDTLEVKEFKAVVGELLRFTLRGNPTRKIRDAVNQERKIRVPVIREDEKKDWLVRKFKPFAEVAPPTVVPPTMLFTEPAIFFRKGGVEGKIKPVLFSGYLRVTNLEKFREAVCVGIGPAKAFGCGLLSVDLL